MEWCRLRSDLPVARVAVAAALVSFATAPVASQTSPGERYLEILHSKARGEYAQALEHAQQLAAEHPEIDVVHRTLVDLVFLDERTAPRRYFEAWTSREPENPYARYGLGRVALRDDDLEVAIAELKHSIALAPDFAEAYSLLSGLPAAYEAASNLEAAIEYFEAVTRSQPDNANAFSGLGWSYARSFDFDRGIEAFTKAIELDADLTHAHHGLVQSYSRMGRYRKSLESCHALREAATRRSDFEMVAYAAMMEGTIAYFRGDFRTALVHLQESLRLAREIGDDRQEASTVGNIAAVHTSSGDYDKSLEYSEASLELARGAGDVQAELTAMNNIGIAYSQTGRFAMAIDRFQRTVELSRELGLRREECLALVNLAETHQLRGDIDDAMRFFNEALTLAESTHSRDFVAFAVNSLGRLHRDLGRSDDAIEFFARAARIGAQTGDVQAIWEAHAGLGSTYARRGEDDEAIAHYAKAIARYDAVRENLAIESMGDAFLEDKYEAYTGIVQLLASRGELDEAFTYAEKFKAKGFLDILARGQTLFEDQLPDALRSELDEVVGELEAAHAELSQARAERHDPATLVALEERVTELELRKSSLFDRVKTEHGEFYQLALSEPIGVERLREKILKPNQALIEYLIGDDKLSIFVVRRDTLHYREVSVGQDELREQVAALSAILGDSEERPPLFNAELADFSLPPARALYDTLLAPIEEWLEEDTELIIVPDDFLFYLPFEVLVAESDDAEHRYDFGAATFVLERYPVSYSPSASLLDPALRRPRQFERGVLAFGNPEVGPGLEEQPPLPNAEREVAAIEKAFRGYDNALLTGGRATESVFKREAANFGILHFAAHFLSDDRQPLYSRIALAAGDDESDDGVLETYEIFGTRLNAELAVLSACNTGLGTLRKGEGLIGISRAFLYAGVPSLVVSLWSVDDDATARIMEHFYRHLRSGASKREALRQAKLDYLHAARGDQKDPFYWAPFILSGDSQPLTFPPATQSLRPFTRYAAMGFLLAVFVLFFLRRRRASARL